MTLDELIAPLERQGEVTQQRGDGHVHIASLADDSRQITAGALFVAVKGERVDGHAYVRQAVAAGRNRARLHAVMTDGRFQRVALERNGGD